MKKSRKGSHSSGPSSNKSSTKNNSTQRKEPAIEIKKEILENEEYNSGFGNYLRSDEGIEMMKLFVVANSLMIIVTMAWPSMKEIYSIIREYFYDQEEF